MREQLNKYKMQLAVLKATLKASPKARNIVIIAVYFLLSGIYFNIALLVQFTKYLINL